MGRRLSKKAIEESLLDQLHAQNKATDYAIDLVRGYMECLDSVRACTKFIREDGEIIEAPNVKGDLVMKEHPALKVRERQLQRMCEIVRTLGLQNPIKRASDKDYL